MNKKIIYVSITGLRLKKPWHILPFYLHAIPAFMQAQKAEGNIFSETKKINGIHHTLTAWTDRKAMMAFLYSGSHGKTLKSFPAIATGKTFGYETTDIPTWDEVHELWLSNGVEYDLPKR